MSLQACAEQVRRGDPDRFLATMTASPAARARLFPLYAFNLEVARAPWITQEPMIAEMRLQWWRDAIVEIGAGKTPRAHEVVGPLASMISDCRLPIDLLDQLIAARRWDIYSEAFEDAAHFAQHIDRTAGHLMWLGALSLGASDALEQPVRDVGFAAGVANWLVAVPRLKALGRLPLVDGRPEAVRDLARDALKRLHRARSAKFVKATPAVRSAWQTRALLKQAARDPGRVAAGTLGISEFRRRLSLIYKSALGGW